MYGTVKKQTPTMSNRDLRSFIETFTFDRCKRGNQGFQRILLQMFGLMGHGKSSLVNTCLMVWRNSPYINHAKAADTQGARTTERHSYRMTENITLVDNRGCTSLNDYETGEIFAQLANLLPLDKPVGWSKGFEVANRIVEAEPHVKSSDFIVPIFVYSVRKTMASEELKDLKEIMFTCRNMTGVFPIVALTHKTYGTEETVKNNFRSIGVEKFVSLENYTQTSPAYSKETHESVIQFLYDAVQDAQFRVNDKLNSESDMMNRKLFVLNYIHNREVESHKRNLERQGAVEKEGMEQAMRLKMDEAEKERQKAKQLHEEEMRRLDEEFERQRQRDQFEYEQKRNNLINPKKKKKEKKKQGEQ